ncbi:MAG: EamA family transporter [Acidobacteriota bacterium]|nr:EamA family transporter [Acidobacteriota bacterium]
MGQIRVIPKWLLYAIIALFWWGIFGFLGKVGADRISPSQMQIFFTIGMVPVAVVCAFRLKFRIATERLGVAYSLLMGVIAALGSLAFFAAMKTGKASLIAPATSLYPALTVVLAVIFLKEKLNKVQLCGLFLAMVSIVILST